jgi:hypothetical protein
VRFLNRFTQEFDYPVLTLADRYKAWVFIGTHSGIR